MSTARADRGRPRGVAARGHPSGAGRRARRPDARDGHQPRPDPARPPRPSRPARRCSPTWPARRPTGATSTGRTSGSASGRSATRPDRDASTRSLASRCLLADGHHRYAAYLQLQQANPGTPWDRGLAMLVDQDDTPLFLGAIHRTLPGTTLDELSARPPARRGPTVDLARQRGARRPRQHTPRPHRRRRRGTRSLRATSPATPLCRWLHERVLPGLPASRSASSTTTTSTTRWRPPAPRRRPCCCRAPTSTRSSASSSRGAAAGEGHVLPAEAEPGRAHAPGDRRMIRPGRLDLHPRARRAPGLEEPAPHGALTSTRSPARQASTLRRSRGLHAVHGTESTP